MAMAANDDKAIDEEGLVCVVVIGFKPYEILSHIWKEFKGQD